MNDSDSEQTARRLPTVAVSAVAVLAFVLGTLGVVAGWIHLYLYGFVVGSVWVFGAAYFRLLDPYSDRRKARHAASYFSAIGVAVLVFSSGYRVPGMFGYRLQLAAVIILGVLAFRRWWRVAVVELGERPRTLERLPVDVLPPERTQQADSAEVVVPRETSESDSENT